MMTEKSKIYWFEPIVFLFFGVFHLHRIWGLIDRNTYAEFWISTMNVRGIFYYVLMGILAILCVTGIIVFFKNIGKNYWWRWIYIFGGGYVLLDLFAIATNLTLWKSLLLKMFDVTSPYWNIIWGMFVVLGLFVFILGISIIKKFLQKQLT